MVQRPALHTLTILTIMPFSLALGKESSTKRRTFMASNKYLTLLI
jgi:hypothetical protein